MMKGSKKFCLCTARETLLSSIALEQELKSILEDQKKLIQNDVQSEL